MVHTIVMRGTPSLSDVTHEKLVVWIILHRGIQNFPLITCFVTQYLLANIIATETRVTVPKESDNELNIYYELKMGRLTSINTDILEARVFLFDRTRDRWTSKGTYSKSSIKTTE